MKIKWPYIVLPLLLLMLLSAVGKWVVFDYFLQPDGSGRMRLDGSGRMRLDSSQATELNIDLPDSMNDSNLIDSLQQGGLVIVMRHTSSPRQLPDASTADPDNINLERQLDETGRREAEQLGAALRRLNIPILEVLSSPAYRAIETARVMGFTDITPVEELGNEGMQASDASRTAWLREQVTETYMDGNRLLITHGPNLSAAFPDYSEDMMEGDALIFDPGESNGPVMIRRIDIDAWAEL